MRKIGNYSEFCMSKIGNFVVTSANSLNEVYSALSSLMVFDYIVS